MAIDIIGAGIGGLTTAIALEKKGFDISIYEQAKEIKPIGAGIILANNAMQVYEKLGIRKQIESKGNPISSVNICKSDLSIISNVDLKYFEEKHKVKNIAIHRGQLQEILIDELKSGTLHLDYKLNNIVKNKDLLSLEFNDNKSLESKTILAADGIHSVVRNCLFPENKIRSSKQICWRGVTSYELPKKYKNELNEAWGKGDRFGFVQVAPKQIYWYALKSIKDHSEYSVNDLELYFNNYHPLIKGIINSTEKSNINTAEILDLSPTNKWHNENVCLLGDAAHATTPNMGQGACQAIEDAYVLSECLGKFDFHKAFSEYQKLRISKANQIVNTSWTLGKIAHLSNPVLIYLRNQMMKMTPSAMNRKQSNKIFTLAKI